LVEPFEFFQGKKLVTRNALLEIGIEVVKAFERGKPGLFGAVSPGAFVAGVGLGAKEFKQVFLARKVMAAWSKLALGNTS
jgi:hypothetical protein